MSPPSNFRAASILILIVAVLTCFSLIAQSPAAAKPIQAIVIKIYPQGLEPPALTLKSGLTSITVLNRTGLNLPPVLTIDRSPGNRAATLPFAERQGRLRSLLELSPGTYVIGVAGRPAFRAELTIR